MLHGPKATQKHAVELRQEMSLPEVLLWQELRKRPDGLKFRRQHPAGRYILDFFCARAKLAVEIDGIAHDMGHNPERDQRRDAWLTEQGVRVVRIPAKQVLGDLNAVIEYLAALAQDPSTTPCGRGSPPLEGEDLRD